MPQQDSDFGMLQTARVQLETLCGCVCRSSIESRLPFFGLAAASTAVRAGSVATMPAFAMATSPCSIAISNACAATTPDFV